MRDMSSIALVSNIYKINCLKCSYMYVCMYAKQKQPGYKNSAKPIRSHIGYKRPKTLRPIARS